MLNAGNQLARQSDRRAGGKVDRIDPAIDGRRKVFDVIHGVGDCDPRPGTSIAETKVTLVTAKVAVSTSAFTVTPLAFWLTCKTCVRPAYRPVIVAKAPARS